MNFFQEESNKRYKEENELLKKICQENLQKVGSTPFRELNKNNYENIEVTNQFAAPTQNTEPDPANYDNLTLEDQRKVQKKLWNMLIKSNKATNKITHSEAPVQYAEPDPSNYHNLSPEDKRIVQEKLWNALLESDKIVRMAEKQVQGPIQFAHNNGENTLSVSHEENPIANDNGRGTSQNGMVSIKFQSFVGKIKEMTTEFKEMTTMFQEMKQTGLNQSTELSVPVTHGEPGTTSDVKLSSENFKF